MDEVESLNESWKLPHLRTLNDFILESSRFQLPNFTDFEKWGNRVVNNLIYYQTNYIYMSIVIMLIVGSMHPMKMCVGLLVMFILWGVSKIVLADGELISALKRYPLARVILVVLSACFIIYNLSSLLLLLFGILLSFCVIFVHASLRLRNLKNKLVNKIEGLGLERTPMGILLKYIGMKEEFLE